MLLCNALGNIDKRITLFFVTPLVTLLTLARIINYKRECVYLHKGMQCNITQSLNKHTHTHTRTRARTRTRTRTHTHTHAHTHTHTCLTA